MTALSKYDRLEASGLWRGSDDDQRRDVIVSFGDATLIIKSTKDQPISHWSLAAFARANPGKFPAIFHPEGDNSETLEIPENETEMIEALEQLRTLIARRRPKPGRLRGWTLVSIIGVILALGVFWLPSAMRNYAMRVVPEIKRQEIGLALLSELSVITGKTCRSALADPALDKVSQRLLGAEDRIKVMPGGLNSTLSLPGGYILVSHTIAEDFEDPDVLSGFVLSEKLRMQQASPLDGVLRHAGIKGTFQLLTTGELPTSRLASYAKHLVMMAPAPVEIDALIDQFRAANIRATPFAYALDITGETTLALLEADTLRTTPSEPTLADGDWIRLQGICGG